MFLPDVIPLVSQQWLMGGGDQLPYFANPSRQAGCPISGLRLTETKGPCCWAPSGLCPTTTGAVPCTPCQPALSKVQFHLSRVISTVSCSLCQEGYLSVPSFSVGPATIFLSPMWHFPPTKQLCSWYPLPHSGHCLDWSNVNKAATPSAHCLHSWRWTIEVTCQLCVMSSSISHTSTGIRIILISQIGKLRLWQGKMK